MWKKKFVEVLEQSYARMLVKNPRFSRRAFARKIGISSGTLSDLTRFKTQITLERAQEILNLLELSPAEKARMNVLMGKSGEISASLQTERECEFLEDWKDRALLCAYDLDRDARVIESICQNFGMSEKEFEERSKKLLREGFLSLNEDGILVRNKVIWKTKDGEASESVHRMHRASLELGLEALEALPLEERDFTSMMFAGNSEQLAQVRQEIRSFYEKVLAIMEEPPADSVFQIAVQLHPVRVGVKK